MIVHSTSAAPEYSPRVDRVHKFDPANQVPTHFVIFFGLERLTVVVLEGNEEFDQMHRET